MIIPTSYTRALAAPNFFVKAKALRGGANVAKRQACDGAVRARAMHYLQTYGEEKPLYNNIACTFSSTYHNSTLKMYTHHVTAPRAEGDRAEYYMTQLKAYALISDREAFVQGATAFRNARDLARRQRESLICTANARTSRTEPAASKEDAGTTSRHNTLRVSMIYSELTAWRDSHDDLQQQIADQYVGNDELNIEAPSTPQHHDSSDEPGRSWPRYRNSRSAGPLDERRSEFQLKFQHRYHTPKAFTTIIQLPYPK